MYVLILFYPHIDTWVWDFSFEGLSLRNHLMGPARSEPSRIIHGAGFHSPLVLIRGRLLSLNGPLQKKPNAHVFSSVYGLMIIAISSIPEEGLTLKVSPLNKWVREILIKKLPKKNVDLEETRGEFFLTSLEKNVSLTGHMDILLHPSCDLCLENFNYPYHVPIKMDMTPVYDSQNSRKRTQSHDDEIELTREDLEFRFYEGDTIDMSELIGEEVVLSLPIRFVCSDACRGLCPRCGINLNQLTCNCNRNPGSGDKWVRLQGLKIKSSKSSE